MAAFSVVLSAATEEELVLLDEVEVVMDMVLVAEVELDEDSATSFKAVAFLVPQFAALLQAFWPLASLG
jgi:hypothetical protein